MNILWLIPAALLAFASVCLGYLYVLALASVRLRHTILLPQPRHRFAIAIPAHNEEAVIGGTIARLQTLDYAPDLYDIHVVSDNSEDRTSEIVRASGVTCWERVDETRRGKGYALAWLFERLLAHERRYDAMIVFDADSQVDPAFLRVMDGEMHAGHRVIQGHHVIANPTDNWFTAVMTIAFIMDNRLRNVGRSNLGFSSKLMGDGMCFDRHILEQCPWATTSLSEDAECQAQLLLRDVRVRFAADAITSGEIPASLAVARHQRARWMQGRADVSSQLASQVLKAGVRNLNLAQLDGAVELLLPSFSTLFVLTTVCILSWVGLRIAWPDTPFHRGWLSVLYAAVIAYPVLGLVLSGAPARLYLYLFYAPLYALWRTGLRLLVRLRRGPTTWVRTPRKSEGVVDAQFNH